MPPKRSRSIFGVWSPAQAAPAFEGRCRSVGGKAVEITHFKIGIENADCCLLESEQPGLSPLGQATGAPSSTEYARTRSRCSNRRCSAALWTPRIIEPKKNELDATEQIERPPHSVQIIRTL
jgi:hypothetical protein